LLEELCEDRGASGSNLKERLSALSKNIVVPAELLQAADQLRILGNDAAHLEAKVYENIGDAEVRLAIGLAKEILKASYQYKGLLSQLKALGKRQQ
jgi:hypothetical protein